MTRLFCLSLVLVHRHDSTNLRAPHSTAPWIIYDGIVKKIFAFLVLLSFLGKAFALAQTNLTRSVPTNHTMPPMEFPLHQHVVPEKNESIIVEPSGALNRWSLYDLPRLTLGEGSINPTNRSFLWQRVSYREDNFSMSNLFDGLIYDFKKKDDARIEFGGPGLGEWNITEADVKYDVPFCLLILLNRKF